MKDNPLKSEMEDAGRAVSLCDQESNLRGEHGAGDLECESQRTCERTPRTAGRVFELHLSLADSLSQWPRPRPPVVSRLHTAC